MVLIPEYLKNSSKQNPNKPRIISEVKKNCLSRLKLNFANSLQEFGKSKFSGQLLWKIGGNPDWVLRTGEVRQGSLILINQESSTVELRLPLRELNLRPCRNNPKTFCLAEAKGIRLLIFQALTEEDYEKWVRILAVELIRQTPLQNVRFLDILSIITNKESSKKEVDLKRGKSEETVSREAILQDGGGESKSKSVMKAVQKSNKVERVDSIPVAIIDRNVDNVDKSKKSWLRTQSMNNLSVCPKDTSDESGISSGDDVSGFSTRRSEVEANAFISVRERKKFFESLNSDGNGSRWAIGRSNSIGNIKNYLADRNKFRRRKRTKSLHDLHKTPVREICRLFESRDRKTGRNEEEEVDEEQEVEEKKNSKVSLFTRRRLLRGEKKLDKLKTQISEVEEMRTIISEDLKRQEGTDLHESSRKRLDEENSRLERLVEEISRVIEGNKRTIAKLEKSNMEKST